MRTVYLQITDNTDGTVTHSTCAIPLVDLLSAKNPNHLLGHAFTELSNDLNQKTTATSLGNNLGKALGLYR